MDVFRVVCRDKGLFYLQRSRGRQGMTSDKLFCFEIIKWREIEIRYRQQWRFELGEGIPIGILPSVDSASHS
jgi:hypothetical protein